MDWAFPMNGRSEGDYSKETIRRSGAHDILLEWRTRYFGSGAHNILRVAHTIFCVCGAQYICWVWRTRYFLGSRKRRGGVGTRKPEADKWQDRSVRKNGAQLCWPRVSSFLSHRIVKQEVRLIIVPGKTYFRQTKNCCPICRFRWFWHDRNERTHILRRNRPRVSNFLSHRIVESLKFMIFDILGKSLHHQMILGPPDWSLDFF